MPDPTTPTKETPVLDKTIDRGSWMQTYTGRQFYPLAALVDDIDHQDIAHSLSLICRYGGHVDRFYSVAEHCILMSHFVSPENAAWALLHDATEAYVGDMVRPLKHHMPEYRDVEDALMAVIAERFGLAGVTIPDEVKDADNRILLTERAALMPNTRHPWVQEDLTPLPVEVLGLPPREIEGLYLLRMDELGLLGGGRRPDVVEPVAVCSVCGGKSLRRATWGKTCGMLQDDLSRCPGTLVPPSLSSVSPVTPKEPRRG